MVTSQQQAETFQRHGVGGFFDPLQPLPSAITVHEVGPRDGLQNEKSLIPTDTKLKLIQLLIDAGLRHIEAGSFVSPKWVPQMADSLAVVGALRARHSSAQGISDPCGLVISALTPNMRGLELAASVGVKEVAVFTACSDTFCRRNINCSTEESLDVYERVCESAKEKGICVRGYVSCAWGCPFEGVQAAEAVVRVARRLLEMGCYEVALGDTIGAATPASTALLLDAVTAAHKSSQGKNPDSSTCPINVSSLAVHFHDTHGAALCNILVALQRGVTTVDSSIAGLGGCPYAGGCASGNVATEAVVGVLQDELGINCGVEKSGLERAVDFVHSSVRRASTVMISEQIATASTSGS